MIKSLKSLKTVLATVAPMNSRTPVREVRVNNSAARIQARAETAAWRLATGSRDCLMRPTGRYGLAFLNAAQHVEEVFAALKGTNAQHLIALVPDLTKRFDYRSVRTEVLRAAKEEGIDITEVALALGLEEPGTRVISSEEPTVPAHVEAAIAVEVAAIEARHAAPAVSAAVTADEVAQPAKGGRKGSKLQPRSAQA